MLRMPGARKLLPIITILLIARCSSNPSSKVLEPVAEGSSPVDETSASMAPVDPALAQVKDLLSKLGYEGVGLEFESTDTLSLLKAVFSDKRTANKDIRFIYTGIAMAYDPAGKALTIGGTRDAATVIVFISKKVPAAPPAKPQF